MDANEPLEYLKVPSLGRILITFSHKFTVYVDNIAKYYFSAFSVISRVNISKNRN